MLTTELLKQSPLRLAEYKARKAQLIRLLLDIERKLASPSIMFLGVLEAELACVEQ